MEGGSWPEVRADARRLLKFRPAAAFQERVAGYVCS